MTLRFWQDSVWRRLEILLRESNSPDVWWFVGPHQRRSNDPQAGWRGRPFKMPSPMVQHTNLLRFWHWESASSLVLCKAPTADLGNASLLCYAHLLRRCSWRTLDCIQGFRDSRIPGFQDSRTWFQDSKFAFFLTPLCAQKIETQQNRCWENPAFTLETAYPISWCANTLDHSWPFKRNLNATLSRHIAKIWC